MTNKIFVPAQHMDTVMKVTRELLTPQIGRSYNTY